MPFTLSLSSRVCDISRRRLSVRRRSVKLTTWCMYACFPRSGSADLQACFLQYCPYRHELGQKAAPFGVRTLPGPILHGCRPRGRTSKNTIKVYREILTKKNEKLNVVSYQEVKQHELIFDTQEQRGLGESGVSICQQTGPW